MQFDLSFRRPAAPTCRVRAGIGVLDALVTDLAAERPARRLVLISDDRVAPLHAEPLVGRLRRRKFSVDLLTFPAGESSKVRRTKAGLEDRLAALGAGRDTALVAVGGGVTGDLAGFVGSTWHRGIPVVQVPTSLLAMADAAVGGKTGVNLSSGKNLVGTFHQPWGVYADVSLLATQPESHFRDGFAEVVKSAAIADARLFGMLERSVDALRRRDPAALERVVTACLRIKGRVVVADEREAGRRAMLNFGHTVGHALEAVSRYRIRHGRAVAVGLHVESRLAERATRFPRNETGRLRGLLEAFGLPTNPTRGASPESIVQATRSDKKARAGRARYALPVRLGRMPDGDDPTVAVTEAALARTLAALAG